VITKVIAYTEAILKAADKASVKRVVLTSSSASAFVTEPGVKIVVTEGKSLDLPELHQIT
jgi:nucleoside-diphosphate-sugar epimerase